MTGDDELLAMVLATYTRHDPVPDNVIESAKAAGALVPGAIDWTWLERLDDPVGVRGPSRVLSFGDGMRAVDLELHREREVTGVHGILTPVAGDARIDVCWPSGRLTAGVDEVGRFEAVGLPTGPLRLVVRCPGTPTVATRWFVA
ncbi:hypothetical protein [Labedaea rhizosphaerae]|uniref:Uncharacterized protein n=1 Tax=Labedaea rhizosphaerae TaxID=598644 RepID=A0A4R6SN26_LABRH|nr:hypothetical protein [Labedaea rhizosphaerae]TDQ05539.1 hypothetical protein EV186_1011513 [Labedaea rhizosphaerae]